jgi:acetoacetyl-CoA reductase
MEVSRLTSKTIAAENVAFGITANAVLPGMTASSGILSMPPEILDAWVATMPMGKLVHTEDIAEAVACFASPVAAQITGQQLTVDGGHALNTMSVTSTAVEAVG